MTPLQHYQLSLYLTTLITAVFGCWVFYKRRGSKTAQLFCLYSLVVGFWSWCQAQAGSTHDPVVSLAWVRVMFYVVVAFPVLLTQFFATFLGVDQRRAVRIGWALVIGVVPWIHTDRFLQLGGPLSFLPSFPRAGTLFPIFNGVWVGWIMYNLLLLARGSQCDKHPLKEQARLLFAANLFGYLLGSTNYLYLYNIVIPSLQPYATYGVPIAFLVIAYGVFAYGLFDIRVVIRRSLVYSLLVTLLTVGYFGLVYGIERMFRMVFGYQSALGSMAAFAVMALVFQPLKIIIQRFVDHLIFHAPQHAVAKRLEVLEQKVLEGEQYKVVATMAAEIAHEMKNPLTAMQAFVDFLPERYNDMQFRQRFYEVVGSEIRRLRQVAQGLLDFAKPQTPQMVAVDIKVVVEDVLALTKPMLLKRAIEVQTTYAHNGATLIGDAMHLRQVFLNLIRNAEQAMTSGGTLTLRTASQNGWLEVRVTDTGCGIRPRDLQHLFEPFFSRKPDGTGLGLSIIQGIVREHRGQIGVQSTPGCGTTVTVRLPTS